MLTIRITEGTGRQYSYSELGTLTYRLSVFLRSSCGVTPEVIIPVALDKSALAIITILAVLRAGATYIPIEPDWPLERVRHILDNTGATRILCSPTGARQYHDLKQEAVVINEGCLDDVVETERDVPSVPSSLALMIFTSGSTGYVIPDSLLLYACCLERRNVHLTSHLLWESFLQFNT